MRVDRDRVAFLDERDRAAGLRLRRDVADDHAPRASREASVRDESDRLAEPLPDQRRGRREHLLHAGPALRSLVADHDDVAGADLLRHDRLHALRLGVEHARRSGDRRILETRDLGDAAVGREIALEDREVALRVHRVVPRPDHFLVAARLGRDALELLADRAAGDRQAVADAGARARAAS